MRNFLLAVVFTFILVLPACRYDDGPKFTIRSSKARITANWYMYQYLENDKDLTDNFNGLFPDWLLEIKKDNTYTISFTFFNGKNTENGKWEFSDANKQINLKKDGTGTNIWKITRLKSHELWAEQTDGNGKRIQYHLKN